MYIHTYLLIITLHKKWQALAARVYFNCSQLFDMLMVKRKPNSHVGKLYSQHSDIIARTTKAAGIGATILAITSS